MLVLIGWILGFVVNILFWIRLFFLLIFVDIIRILWCVRLLYVILFNWVNGLLLWIVILKWYVFNCIVLKDCFKVVLLNVLMIKLLFWLSIVYLWFFEFKFFCNWINLIWNLGIFGVSFFYNDMKVLVGCSKEVFNKISCLLFEWICCVFLMVVFSKLSNCCIYGWNFLFCGVSWILVVVWMNSFRLSFVFSWLICFIIVVFDIKFCFFVFVKLLYLLICKNVCNWLKFIMVIF